MRVQAVYVKWRREGVVCAVLRTAVDILGGGGWSVCLGGSVECVHHREAVGTEAEAEAEAGGDSVD